MSVVVLGTGSIGQRHLRVARDLGFDPVAMSTRGASDRPELLPFRRAASWEEAQKLAGGGLAVIATNTSRHVADAHAAIDAGFDVLVEKPIAPTTAGLRALAAHAAHAKRLVHVACNLRFTRGFSETKRKLVEIGTIYSARVECQSYLPSWRPGTDHRTGYAARADEGGVTRDLVHEIDFTCALLGAPRALFARFVNTGELEIAAEESADLSWIAPAGAVVSLRLDYLARVRRRSATFVARSGELVWDLARQVVITRPADGVETVLDVSEDRDDTMKRQLQAVLAERAGKPTSFASPATFEDGARAAAIIEAAARSAASRREEQVTDWRSE